MDRISTSCLLALLLIGAALPAWAQTVGEVFRRVNPSVVVISAQWHEPAGRGQLARISEIGSGFLISAQGQVITAAHVVQTADSITAEFLGGERVSARVTASEPAADVALLQLERVPPQSVVASMGDSSKVQVGDPVFVIGAPYGIGHTLSVGHLSARYRPNTVDSDMALAELLQTDAALNPGNSGGPMFNMAGEVIGVASHNITRSGGFEGLGFVVTINMARRLLLEERSFWSGLAGIMVTGDLARALNLPQVAGVLVQQVAVNSPAARMGLRAGTIPATVDGRSLLLGGDVILSVLGVPIGQESYEERRERVRQVPPGSLVTVTVLRDGQPVTLSRTR
ncbi:MAG TPA: trypsin-like peptidase domain-containing protein [Candidatus Methylomirabilis sp.]|nr:trypsin-like peptidase domain-containing protein [Candidatus Methylomirabilis sp.]